MPDITQHEPAGLPCGTVDKCVANAIDLGIPIFQPRRTKMSKADAAQRAALPPEAQIAEILLSQLASRLVHLAATLKLPDRLADGPRTAEELAPLTSTHAPALYRVMRTLASLGFFSEDAEHRFALRPLGAILKTGTPSHAAALILGGEIMER